MNEKASHHDYRQECGNVHHLNYWELQLDRYVWLGITSRNTGCLLFTYLRLFLSTDRDGFVFVFCTKHTVVGQTGPTKNIYLRPARPAMVTRWRGPACLRSNDHIHATFDVENTHTVASTPSRTLNQGRSWSTYKHVSRPHPPQKVVASGADAAAQVFEEGMTVGIGAHGNHCQFCEACSDGDFMCCDKLEFTGTHFAGGYQQ